jgi:hypothetical protein
MIFIPASVYAFNETTLYVSNVDGIRLNQIIDACKANYNANNTSILYACQNFVEGYHKYMTGLFNETKQDIIKILVGP